VSPCSHVEGTITAVEGMVGCVRQDYPGAHPYLPHLLLGLAGELGLASRPGRRSGRQARVRQNLVGVPGRSLSMHPASDRSPRRGYKP
jgi:hypothetical protein